MNTDAPPSAGGLDGAARGPGRTARETAQGSALHLVTAPELDSLRRALALGGLPADLRRKLATLGPQDLKHEFLRRHGELIAGLLQASAQGNYLRAGPVDLGRLLRALAYLRKDDDAIPDPLPGGYADDYEEMRAVVAGCAPLLNDFKAWRLREAVPKLWLSRSSVRWELQWHGAV